MWTRPASCSSARRRIIEAYATSTSGCQLLSRSTTLSGGSPESRRKVGTQGLWTEAPTLADWCQGTVELTTAILVRWVRPALEPAQSNERLYEATTMVHSAKSQRNRPLRPVLPDVEA